MDKGILYGVGVGPGDPELLTIKALKVIKECDAIALPVSGTADKTQITAYQIVWKIYPEINKKRIIFLSMPMTKDKKALQQVRKMTVLPVSHASHSQILPPVSVYTGTLNKYLHLPM